MEELTNNGAASGASAPEWVQIRASGRRELLDGISAVMSMVDAKIQVEDYGDLDELILDGVYGDLIDESVLNADREHIAVSVYVPTEKSPAEAVSYLRGRFDALGMDVTVETRGVSEEDWVESWKQYYHPIRIGRVVIVPAWEKFDAADGDVIVTMDPGMAFGTGTHETTRLVVGMMDEYMKKGDRVLDLGCGSGILSICASKLGARECFAYDIDPVAVRVTRENIKDNGVCNVDCGVSDLLRDVDRSDKYDLIVANIVADIILRMVGTDGGGPDAQNDVGAILRDGGVLIVSGIIDERAHEVTDAFLSAGWRILSERHENGWCAAALSNR